MFMVILQNWSHISPQMARNRYNDYSYLDYLSNYLSDFPFHLCLFLFVLFLVLCLSWYVNYEYMYEDVTSQVKLFLMLCPLFLLLLLHFLSADTPRRVPLFVPLLADQKESIHRVGGSPFGIALLLAFILFLVAHQSSFHQRWFPLITR
ncbi:hypothetical protein SAY86_001639 [Trapa natans]|uniref:Uncharacterized protein n=1 Tax=Trapa natans TaxID=22666 RepID=A0AAN7LGH2_TRANT|nr:hypothetical protein SAY86_001639 [Trapa natans]